MKIAIIGGHMTPALAVIQKLPKDIDILYIGRKYPVEGDKGVSLEYLTITEMNIPFIPITTAKLQRHLTRHTIPSLAKLPKGLSQSFRILKKYKPDAILSFGGYVSVPICFAAYLLKVPIIIHEQTTEAGMANKIISFFAKKVCISFELSRPFFPKEKTVLTGDPVPQFIPTEDIKMFQKQEDDMPLVVFTGGSQGSHRLNELVEANLQQLLKTYQVIHQTGDAKEFEDFDRLQKLRKQLPENLQKRYFIMKFIHPFDIEEVYRQADLVVSRSGINTVLLLALLNKPALLMPLPYGQRNEQLKNARFFKEIGLGDIIIQSLTTPESFLKKIHKMIDHLNQYTNKKPELIDIHRHAAEKIIEIIKENVRGKAS